jgi:hypothetical protein
MVRIQDERSSFKFKFVNEFKLFQLERGLGVLRTIINDARVQVTVILIVALALAGALLCCTVPESPGHDGPKAVLGAHGAHPGIHGTLARDWAVHS